ncbi:hypothetical protein D3C81_1306670 [compost metagenome]
MPYAVAAWCPVVTVVFIFIHTQAAGQREGIGYGPFIFSKQRPTPAGQLVQTVCRFQLVTVIAQFFITVLPASRQGMCPEENLVLIVKNSVIGLHLTTRVIGLFLLNIAGGVEVVVVTAVG